MAQLFTNNATSTLNGAIAANTMQITLNTGDGAKFPSPTNGDFFLFTLFQHLNGYEVNWEIVSCTGRTGDVLTVGARGLENTTALPYNNGDFIELRLTASFAGSLALKNSPVLTTPTLAATPAAADNSLAVPTTAFVKTVISTAIAAAVTTWIYINPAIVAAAGGTYVAVAGGAYDIDTSTGPVSLMLPTGMTANQTISWRDYAGTFATNNATIVVNGNKINGQSTNLTSDINYETRQLTYTDANVGCLLA
jgi:hypothetical protein